MNEILLIILITVVGIPLALVLYTFIIALILSRGEEDDDYGMGFD